ncbi:MAG: hypothetical protein JNL74_15370 [Fibrobacteres bacterium]|nr:hypothetical protein [Fibrobacterota bacterium]
MTKISNREKLISALKCEKNGFVPISPLGMNRFEWTNNFPSYKKVIAAVTEYGTPIVKIPFDSAHFLADTNVTQPKTEVKTEGDVDTIKMTLQTPKGELYSLSKRNRKVAGGSAALKFLIENDSDIEKMMSLYSCKTALPDLTSGLAKMKEVGDEGLTCFNGIKSPFAVVADYFKYEFFLEWAFSNPEMLREIVELYFKRNQELITYLIDSGAGPVFRWYNIEGYTTPMMPPSFADEFIVPYDTKLMKMVKDAGGFIDNHCHGQLKDQARNFVKMGVDCINCVEPPPANDINLRDLRKATDGKICFWGYIQWDDMERKTTEEIRALTREAIDMSGGYGFILSQAASAYASEISEKFSENMLAMIDEGRRFNAL